MQTVRGGERLERCRMNAAEGPVFACPENCLFFEARSVSNAGWTQDVGRAGRDAKKKPPRPD